jgi:hypothetical protein
LEIAQMIGLRNRLIAMNRRVMTTKPPANAMKGCAPIRRACSGVARSSEELGFARSHMAHLSLN